jgi:pyruvate formate-lyase activating enzyme-like uncharacterized protein
MIVEIERVTLNQVRNPVMAAYAARYLDIYEDFLAQVGQLGIQVAEQDERPAAQARREHLRAQGAWFRNNDHSIYVNHISPACEACQLGVGSATFYISLRCHRDCFYCFNPNQENYALHQVETRDVAAELETLAASGQQVSHLALTGGEPLLYKEQAAGFFQTAQQVYPKSYLRLYTSGDHADRATLEQLRDSGLDEIRLSIRMHDLAGGHRLTFDRLRLAREHIPYVMVEMPVLPGTLEEMKGVLDELEQIGIFSINLLEFCFPYNNAEAYNQRGYQIKRHPFQVLYDYWYAGGLPVAGSELVCLDLLAYALEQNMQMGVHYCSLENKHTGQIYQQHFNRPLPQTAYFSRKDYFLKSARVYGEDIPPVLEAFQHLRYDRYQLNEAYNFLEFHIGKIPALRGLEVQVGISTSVIEERQGQPYLRELKLDLTTPEWFDLAHDL